MGDGQRDRSREEPVIQRNKQGRSQERRACFLSHQILKLQYLPGPSSRNRTPKHIYELKYENFHSLDYISMLERVLRQRDRLATSILIIFFRHFSLHCWLW